MKKQGRKNRTNGRDFEVKVRHNLEGKGWIVCKWQNNVEFMPDTAGKLIPARRKYNPFTKFCSFGNGFPDFIAHREITNKPNNVSKMYEVMGIEVKSKGYLDKEEREKCEWILKNNIFSKILIASKGERRGEIEFEEFKIK